MSLPSDWFNHLKKKDTEFVEPIFGKVILNLSSEIAKILGRSGRMLSASKSSYRDLHPQDTVYFNACIFDKKGTQIWFGDLNLTKESDKLQQVADLVGEIYVTPESARWNGLDKKVDRVVKFVK